MKNMMNINPALQSNSPKLDILIALDQPRECSVICDYLRQWPCMNIKDVAKDGIELLSKLKKHNPKVVLLDWELNKLATSVVSTLHTIYPDVALVALSRSPINEQSTRYTGVDSFISKYSSLEEIAAALRASSGWCEDMPDCFAI
jgi:DNA-binding NarL/FixJ family response regulator